VLVEAVRYEGHEHVRVTEAEVVYVAVNKAGQKIKIETK
jgi:acyl-CoA hydrolase